MEAIKNLAQRLSALVGGNLNGFFAGIAVALYFMWSSQDTKKPRVQGGASEPVASTPAAADGKAEESPDGDLDEVALHSLSSFVLSRSSSVDVMSLPTVVPTSAPGEAQGAD